MILTLQPYTETHARYERTLAERLSARIDYRGDASCWEWRGYRDRREYGRVDVGRRCCLAHRIVYELLAGPIPDGLVLDHLCRNHGCVNPAHLEPVTQRENLLRGQGFVAANVLKTHCPAGHPYNDENTDRKYGWRVCIVCRRRRAKQYYYQAKAVR